MKHILRKISIFFRKKPVRILLIFLVIFAIVFMSYTLVFNDENEAILYEDYTISTGHKGEIKEYDPSFTVDGYQGDRYRAYYITGKISSKEDKGFTVITFNLYDEDDNLLGTAVSGLNEMKKGQFYDFKALSLVENIEVEKIDHYEIESIKLGEARLEE